MSEFYRQVFKAGLEAMQQGGTAAELATSDGRYKISQDPVYKRLVLYQLRDIGSTQAWVAFHPEKLEEKIAKSSADTWKRELAERKDARDAESHQADMTIKRVQVMRLQKRFAPETVPQRCKVAGCPASGVVFRDMAAYNEHLREIHPDRITDSDRGVSMEKVTAGEFYRRDPLPELKWQGQTA